MECRCALWNQRRPHSGAGSPGEGRPALFQSLPGAMLCLGELSACKPPAAPQATAPSTQRFSSAGAAHIPCCSVPFVLHAHSPLLHLPSVQRTQSSTPSCPPCCSQTHTHSLMLHCTLHDAHTHTAAVAVRPPCIARAGPRTWPLHVTPTDEPSGSSRKQDAGLPGLGGRTRQYTRMAPLISTSWFTACLRAGRWPARPLPHSMAQARGNLIKALWPAPGGAACRQAQGREGGWGD